MESDSTFSYFFVIQIVVFIAIVVFILKYAQKKMLQKLEPLRMELGGEIKGSLLTGMGLHFLYNGNQVVLKLLPGGKNSPPTLSLEQPAMLPFHTLVITNENAATLALQKIGLLKDMKTGDPVFDRKYNIRSNEAMEVANYLMSDKKEIIDRLFTAGFGTFFFNGKKLTLSKPGYTDNDATASAVSAYANDLNKLATI